MIAVPCLFTQKVLCYFLDEEQTAVADFILIYLELENKGDLMEIKK